MNKQKNLKREDNKISYKEKEINYRELSRKEKTSSHKRENKIKKALKSTLKSDWRQKFNPEKKNGGG